MGKAKKRSGDFQVGLVAAAARPQCRRLRGGGASALTNSGDAIRRRCGTATESQAQGRQGQADGGQRHHHVVQGEE